MAKTKLDRAFEWAELLLELAVEVFKAVRKKDVRRVEEILPAELRITLARLQAERRADEKFGPRRSKKT